MKSVKIFLVLLIAVACIMPTLVPSQAQAATWITCYVNQTGQSGPTKYIQLTDATGTVPSINGTWFIISDGLGTGNVLLSTALTAMVSGMKVQTYTNLTEYSSITVLYLLGQ